MNDTNKGLNAILTEFGNPVPSISERDRWRLLRKHLEDWHNAEIAKAEKAARLDEVRRIDRKKILGLTDVLSYRTIRIAELSKDTEGV